MSSENNSTVNFESVQKVHSQPVVEIDVPELPKANPVKQILITIDKNIEKSDHPILETLKANTHLQKLHNIVFGVKDDSTLTSSVDTGFEGDLTVTNTGSNSFLGSIWTWITKHKLLATVLAIGFVGGTAYYLHKVNSGEISGPKYLKLKKTRLALKASNGGRIEVVVIAGSPTEPLTRTIATDLSRRGFIIYWTTSTEEEEDLVLRENNEDIRPLPIRAHDIKSVRKSIKSLSNALNVPSSSFPGAIPHMLSLTGVIVVPDLYYPTGPVECIDLVTWSELLNAKLLGPMFLLSNGLLDLVRSHQSRVLFVSPTILGSLNPGYNAAEALVTSALRSFTLSLSRELKPQGIPFIHVRMGTFQISSGQPKYERQVQNTVRNDILSWPENLRALYSRPYQTTSALQVKAKRMGSPIRVLNYTIFDALEDSNPKRVYYAGKGAWLYHMLALYLPEDVVASWLHPPPPKAPLALQKGWEPI